MIKEISESESDYQRFLVPPNFDMQTRTIMSRNQVFLMPQSISEEDYHTQNRMNTSYTDRYRDNNNFQ